METPMTMAAMMTTIMPKLLKSQRLVILRTAKSDSSFPQSCIRTGSFHPLVAKAPYSSKVLRAAGLLFNLHAESAYVNIDDLIIAEVAVAPHGGQQGAA